IAGEALDAFAVRKRLSLPQIVGSRTQLPAQRARYARRAVAVDYQAGDLLAAARAVDARLVRVHPEPFRFDDPPHDSDERPDFRRALVTFGQAESEVIGVARVAPAERCGQSADPPVEPQAKRVRQGGAGRRSLGQTART